MAIKNTVYTDVNGKGVVLMPATSIDELRSKNIPEIANGTATNLTIEVLLADATFKYKWDPTSVADDNDTDVIAITGIEVGRWLRVKDGMLALYAKLTDILGFSSGGGSVDLSEYATVASLSQYVPNTMLASLAKVADLANYVQTTALAAYVTATTLANYTTTAGLVIGYATGTAYIRLPTWLGGWMFVGGAGTVAGYGVVNVSFPLAFQAVPITALACPRGSGAGSSLGCQASSKTLVSVHNEFDAAPYNFYYFVFGR